MTEELFRADSYLRDCTATVVAAAPGGIVLDRTVFYPTGGGQPGDAGRLTLADGSTVDIVDTVKGEDGIRHVPPPGAPLPPPGEALTAAIDWDRRFAHMRVHTALHLLCVAIDGGVTGGQVGAGKGRLDFDLPDTQLDKAAIEARLNDWVREDHAVSARWISEEELRARDDLVRTMSVAPPSGHGQVRLVEISGVDLQACGGTHVRSTGEIGRLEIGKIENKGRRNRRVNIRLAV